MEARGEGFSGAVEALRTSSWVLTTTEAVGSSRGASGGVLGVGAQMETDSSADSCSVPHPGRPLLPCPPSSDYNFKDIQWEQWKGSHLKLSELFPCC